MNPASVLVVEDDATTRLAIQVMLREEGFPILGTADTGESACQSARDLHPEIVLMDIDIPGSMDGIAAAQHIITETGATIVYLSGYSDPETVSRACATGPAAYLVKPFSRRELAITLQMAQHRRRIETRLRESEERLAAVLAHVDYGVAHLDPDRRVRYLNQPAERLLGCRAADALGRTLAEIWPAGRTLEGEPLADPAAALGLGVPQPTPPGPHLWESAAGPRIWHSVGTALTGGPGATCGWVLTWQDLTPRWESEDRVHQLASALENLEDGVLLTDVAFGPVGPTILHANRGFTRLTGWEREDWEGKPLTLLDPSPDALIFLHALREASVRGQTFHDERTNRTRDGRLRRNRWTVVPVPDRRGRPRRLVIILRDVTSLRTMEDNMLQARKLEALGRLAAGVAHDFNNLLSVINTYGDLLLHQLPAGEPTAEYSRRILHAGRRGVELVRQLLTFSRHGQPREEVCDLALITQALRDLLRRLVRENVELATEITATPCPVRGDRGQIEQILVNLTLNAREAMPGGGRLTVRVDPPGVDPAPAGKVRLTVTDTGCGMDAETLQHVFDPFFTTKEAGPTKGMGLAVVYGIVKGHGGDIAVRSEPGRGTTFEIDWPACPEAARALPAAVTRSHPTGSILVVEDDADLRECFLTALRLHQYEVWGAADGTEAEEIIRREGLNLDLLISDLVLPGLSGQEIAKRAREARPGIKLILITGYWDQAHQFELPGADAILLEKPFPLQTLLAEVGRLLGDSAPAAAPQIP